MLKLSMIACDALYENHMELINTEILPIDVIAFLFTRAGEKGDVHLMDKLYNESPELVDFLKLENVINFPFQAIEWMSINLFNVVDALEHLLSYEILDSMEDDKVSFDNYPNAIEDLVFLSRHILGRLDYDHLTDLVNRISYARVYFYYDMRYHNMDVEPISRAGKYVKDIRDAL